MEVLFITLAGIIFLVAAVAYIIKPPKPIDVKAGWWRTSGGGLALIIGYDPYTHPYTPWIGVLYLHGVEKMMGWQRAGFSTCMGDRTYSPTDLEEYLGTETPAEIKLKDFDT